MVITGLPQPRKDRLTLYFGGPGFGESTVLHTPSGHWIVMDVWEEDGVNFPCEVLRQCDARKTDLFILSHTDSDHIRGFPTVHEQFPIECLWHYPINTFNQFLANSVDARSTCMTTPSRRLQHIRRATEVIDQITEYNQTTVASYTTPPYHAGQVSIIPIAPVNSDIQGQRLESQDILKFSDGEVDVNQKLRGYLLHHPKVNSPDTADPNHISIAVTVSWGTTSVLLGGDVHYNPKNSRSGWSGILNYLQECEHRGSDYHRTLQVLRRLTIVKMPHHASRTSFAPELWQLHAAGLDGARCPVPWALIAPFRFGKASLMPPHSDILEQLRSYVSRSCCTASPEDDDGGWERFERAEWRVHPTPEQVVVGQGPWICLDMDDDGHVELRGVGDAARMFAARA